MRDERLEAVVGGQSCRAADLRRGARTAGRSGRRGLLAVVVRMGEEPLNRSLGISSLIELATARIL